MARDIRIKITGDSSGLKKAFGAAEKDAEGFGSKVGGILGGIAKVGGLVAAGGIAAAVPLLKDAVGAASDFNEALSKTQVLFGSSSDAVVAWADDAAQNIGLSRQAALDAAGSFAVFGKSMGLTGGDLADFAKKATGLGADLDSFFNSETAGEGAEAIGAALRGESEPIRRFGVMLNEDTLKAVALSKGLVTASVDTKKFGTAQEAAEKAARKTAKALKEHGANSVEYTDAVRDQEQAEAALAEVMDGKVPQLTQAQKMQAAYLSILDQTTDAQGDFERTAGGLANKQRQVAAEFANTKQELGAAFLPVMLKVSDVILTKILPAFREFARWVNHIAEVFRTAGWEEAAKEVLGKVGDAISAVAGWIRDTGAPALWEVTKELAHRLADWVKDPAWPWLLEHLGQWLSDFGGWITGTALPWLWDQVKALAGAFADWVMDPALPWLLSHLGDWLSDFGKWFATDAVPWLGKKVWELAGIFADWVNDSAKKLAENLPGWLGAFTRWFVSDALPTVVIKMAEFGSAMANWVADAGIELVKNLPGWIASFSQWMLDHGYPAVLEIGANVAKKLAQGVWGALDFMGDVARAIVDGIIDGMWENAQRLAGALADWVDKNIPGPIKKVLQIFSPSKVMVGIGGQIADGLAVGIEAGAAQVAASSQLLAAAAVPAVEWPDPFQSLFPTITRNPDATYIGADKVAGVTVGAGGALSTVVTPAKATSSILRPLGLGDDATSGSLSLSSSGYGAGGGVYNITINGVIIGTKEQLGAYLSDVLRQYDRARA